jgi:hypothetical protein
VQTGHEFIFIEEEVYSQVLDLQLTLEEHHHILREEYSLTHFLNHLKERKEREQSMAAARARQAEAVATSSNAVPPMPLACPPGQDQLPAMGNLQRLFRPIPFRNMTRGPRGAALAAKPNGVQKTTDRCGTQAPAMARNSAVLGHLANTAMAQGNALLAATTNTRSMLIAIIVPSHPAPRHAILEGARSMSPAVNADANMQISGDAPGEPPALSGTYSPTTIPPNSQNSVPADHLHRHND